MYSNSLLFRCTRCNCVDSVELAQDEVARINAQRKAKAEAEIPHLPGAPVQFAAVAYQSAVCTQCLTGQWHNQFPKQPYNPTTDRVLNPPIH